MPIALSHFAHEKRKLLKKPLSSSSSTSLGAPSILGTEMSLALSRMQFSHLICNSNCREASLIKSCMPFSFGSY
ncbi:hypothetical protein [Rhizobium chutanense]|uniref:hypothetical protein n=1 Tax=Rhizobium chutanense TaxID=2035448 RepID=UPI0013DFD3C6|nr:hypothetical protein [Rhizobium chutanense]